MRAAHAIGYAASAAYRFCVDRSPFFEKSLQEYFAADPVFRVKAAQSSELRRHLLDWKFVMVSEFTAWLFDPVGLTPHGFCLLWEPGLIWTYAVSDSVIALAYFTIPAALAVLAHRRRDLVFRPLFWLFAMFILLCGTTHLLDVVTLWLPAYRLESAVKAATAATSILTAIVLWRLLPQALSLPSHAQLRGAYAALRESEARARESFEYSPAPLVRLDGDGAITSASNSWLSLLGYAREDVIGRDIRDFAAPGSHPWLNGDRATLAAGSETYNLEQRYVCRDGTVVDALVSTRLEQGSGGNWSVCHLNDITARRQAEEALRAAEAQLHQAQKMEAVGQLTGGIAHDFNNMLQGVAGSLELIEQRIAQGRLENVARYVGIARSALERASGLTHRMLAFARRQTLQPRPVEPDALVRGMADLLRGTLGPGIEATVSLHDGVWRALCDPNQLESALLNLALNARDAMPDGGSLTLATADRTLAAGDVTAYEGAEPGDYVEIAVGDTGAGMSPDVLAHVFEPFFTTKPLGLGTGLGLSQVYGFVRQSGGFVRIDSVPGQGTMVRLFLPRYRGAEAAQSESTEMPPVNPIRPASRNQTVLVVEDEDDVRTMIAEVLRNRGCTVLEARDGPAGLALVETSETIDLLVSDVGLPGLNGRQLADAARKARPDLPVLLITGYAGAALNATDLASGIEVLRKPFVFEVLAARVIAMLEKTEGPAAGTGSVPPAAATQSCSSARD
jgi:PAS domain S-box-containing protein